jgi:hypothetical protein
MLIALAEFIDLPDRSPVQRKFGVRTVKRTPWFHCNQKRENAREMVGVYERAIFGHRLQNVVPK